MNAAGPQLNAALKGTTGSQSMMQKAPINLSQLTKTLDFNHVFSEIMAGSNGVLAGTQIDAERKKRVAEPSKVVSSDEALGINGEMDVTAQVQGVQPGVQGAAATAELEVLNRVPLQMFLDKTIDALDKLSRQEFRMNDLIEGFVEGRVSEDEVIVETAKLNLSMQMVTTIVQSAVQSFKEILQIAV